MTSLILNGKAVCCMHMGNFEEAETLLLEALNKVSDKPFLVSCHQIAALEISLTKPNAKSKV